MKVHVISNTHWDRAWVYPFQETRLLLLDFMDDLLDLLEQDPKFHSFILDSQTIAVEDYLALRPEREEQLKKFVREGKLIVGPWYNLPEEFIVNGESLVRNLLVGHRYANEYGKVSKIGYTPFSYGQTSQMPQIYQGFDIDTILFYRGINTKKSEFILEGPDGSRLLGCRFGVLSRFSYYFYVYRMARFGMSRDEWWYDWDRGALPFRLNNERHTGDHYYPLDVVQEQFDLDILPPQLKKLIDDESEHFTTGHIACMQGFDCSSPDPNESALVEACHKVAKELGHELSMSSLEDFIHEMRKEVVDPEVITGESRNPGATGKWTHLMGDVISSRTKIKRRNAQTETYLQRWAEPFSCLGWLVGGEYMKSALDLSWKYLLQNHPHDNICGAGIDQMEKDMMYRFDQSVIISQGVIRRGIAAITKAIDNTEISIDEAAVTVFNPSPYPRTEVVALDLDLPDESGFEGYSLRDSAGNAISFCETSRAPQRTLVRNLQDISLHLCSQRVRILTEFENIPAFGYKTFHLKKEPVDQGKLESTQKPVLPLLENEFLRVKINEDGTLNLLDKSTGHEFKDQHYFEESGESGHSWIHMEPEQNQTILTRGVPAEISLIESNDFLTKYKVTHCLEIPKGMEGDDGNYYRSPEKVEMTIETWYTLRKGQKWLDIHTRIDNQAEQHRVRACFPTGLQIEVSAAEASFDVIERPVIVSESSPYWGKPNPQYPMHRFVDMSDSKLGLAVLNDGIREYEALVDHERTIALTLFRGFTAMQSPVIDQWEIYPEMKLSQSLGINEWRYAIMPHDGDWLEGGVFREAENFLLPLESAQSGKGGGSLPKELSFIEIESPQIALSALKKCEHRDTLVLRLFNPTSSEVQCNVKFYKNIKNAWLTNMNEERRENLDVDEHSISLQFGRKKIVTCEIELPINQIISSTK